MKRLLFLLAFVQIAIISSAQLTLEKCHQMAHDNYPLIRRYKLVEQSRDFTLSNATTGYLPQIKLGANSIYISDVVDLPANLKSGALDMGHNMYGVNVQVNQTIYDGGYISSNKRIARAQSEVQNKQLDVNMYDINERIDQIYFGVLIIDEQIKQNMLLQKDLGISSKTIASMIKGGMANQTDADVIKVEEIKAQQQESSLRVSRRTYLSMLATFIGSQIDEKTELERPELVSVSAENHRPELDFYSSQNSLLNAKRKALDVALMPKFSAFAVGLYSHQMTSLVNNAIFGAGITMSWSIGSLYTRKNDIRKLDIEHQQIDNDRNTFLFNIQLQNQQYNGNIENLKQQISQDDDIITLRDNIRSKSEKKVQNGTETVNEMLRDINAVSEARQTKANHEIQLLNEVYRLKNLLKN